jgi:triacylglycerol esterase/lipase EstA (alpha/beta hydrolase family)
MRGSLRTTIALALALALPASAQAVTYAPVDQQGPALSPSAADLNNSLDCSGSTAPIDGAATTPVLLIHGTGSDPEHSFSWNWERALNNHLPSPIPWCTVALAGHGMADIQVSGEYVVNAIRAMYARAGRKISIIGHSQGGMIPRWALRFWPDTRSMVDDVIGLAPSNHGTDGAHTVCNPDCSPAFWQQASGSNFVNALNSYQETFAGISYTVAYTHTDWVVMPNQDATTGSSSLRTGPGQISNIAIQDICPTDVNEHLAIGTIDNVAYRIAMDALEHPGPANLLHLDPTTDPTICAPFQPGVNPATVAADEADSNADLFSTIGTYPHVPAEPQLKCYVFAGGCPPSARQPTSRRPAKKCKKRRGHHKQRSLKPGCKKKRHKHR